MPHTSVLLRCIRRHKVRFRCKSTVRYFTFVENHASDTGSIVNSPIKSSRKWNISRFYSESTRNEYDYLYRYLHFLVVLEYPFYSQYKASHRMLAKAIAREYLVPKHLDTRVSESNQSRLRLSIWYHICTVTILHYYVPWVQCCIRGGIKEFWGPIGQGAELRCFVCNRQGLYWRKRKIMIYS